MTLLKYEFTNFSDQSFTGRFAGIDYTFAPGETRSFDPDKHYMLLLMAKQLADRELVRKIKMVGRDPKDMETWGKSLDDLGRPFIITSDMRKSLMYKAIGSLVDTPVPTPEQATDEAGATKESSTDIKTLQDEVSELKELVASLTTALKSPPVIPSISASPTNEPTSTTREVLTSLAADLGITETEHMTKEELIRAVNSRQAQI